jgi:ribose transport system substrate-binding protein
MKSLPFLGWTACAVLLAAIVGCKSDSSKPKVAFVSNNPEAFWNIAEAGARKAEKDFSVQLLFRKPSPGNAATQKEEIDTAINQGVKAIAVSVIDPKNQSDYLDEIAGKVSLLTQDNDAPKSKRLAYIGTNNYEAGRAAGKLVKEVLGADGGTVVIFVGQLEALNARQRRQGVIDELADRKAPSDLNDFTPSPDGETHGKFKLFEQTYLDQPEGARKAKENAEDALAKLPADASVCMVGLWAYNPPMILSAVNDKVKDKKRREKIKIVGFDEDATTLDGIKNGEIYGTVVQDPFNFGYESVKMMASLARGDKSVLPKDGMRYIPHRIIMKEAGEKNGLKRLEVESFRAELDKLMGKK